MTVRVLFEARNGCLLFHDQPQHLTLSVGSMMNGLQTLPQWREFFGHPEGALLGLMNAVYPLGKVFGMIVVTYVSDRWGRKLPLLIGLVTCIAFAIMQGLAQNLATFVTARALLGFATSFISQPSPILITEVAYPTHRGKITAMYNTFYVSPQMPVSDNYVHHA